MLNTGIKVQRRRAHMAGTNPLNSNAVEGELHCRVNNSALGTELMGTIYSLLCTIFVYAPSYQQVRNRLRFHTI